MVGSPDAIRALVEPSLASSGLELWDVELTRDTVRVLVDRPGGVDLDALAEVAGKVVSPLLDEHPELTPAGQFSLEVSSPGVERTLRRPEQYARYVGSEISVKTSVPVEGARRHQGVLLSADEAGIVITPRDGVPGTTVSISHPEIDRARTVLVWGPAEKPGGKGAKARAKGAAAGATRAGTASTSGREAAKRPAATDPAGVAQPVASREKESE
jgi:ribosome maturation factor RimP